MQVFECILLNIIVLKSAKMREIFLKRQPHGVSNELLGF